jgi:hypothetical protein
MPVYIEAFFWPKRAGLFPGLYGINVLDNFFKEKGRHWQPFMILKFSFSAYSYQ